MSHDLLISEESRTGKAIANRIESPRVTASVMCDVRPEIGSSEAYGIELFAAVRRIETLIFFRSVGRISLTSKQCPGFQARLRCTYCCGKCPNVPCQGGTKERAVHMHELCHVNSRCMTRCSFYAPYLDFGRCLKSHSCGRKRHTCMRMTFYHSWAGAPSATLPPGPGKQTGGTLSGQSGGHLSPRAECFAPCRSRSLFI